MLPFDHLINGFEAAQCVNIYGREIPDLIKTPMCYLGLTIFIHKKDKIRFFMVWKPK